MRVEQVECKCGSLNQGDVFILDCGVNIFVWIGPKSSKIEKIKGANIARKIRDEEKAGRAIIHIVGTVFQIHFTQTKCNYLIF